MRLPLALATLVATSSLCADFVSAQSYFPTPYTSEYRSQPRPSPNYYAVSLAAFRGEYVADRNGPDNDVPPPPGGYMPRQDSPAGAAPVPQAEQFDVPPEGPQPVADETVMEYQHDAIPGACANACGACCEPGWTLSGWLNGGATYNDDSPASRFNGPVTFNDRNDGGFNQAYLVLEKKAVSDGCSWDLGGRIDVMYGTDYVFLETVGVELDDNGNPHWNGGPRYGMAAPQFYAELASPLVSVKAGLFDTLIGYEKYQAPGNFFYSHSYHMQYGEPFKHAGVLATMRSGCVEVSGGAVNGWDKLDAEEDRVAAIVGMTYTSCDDRISISLSAITGEEDGTVTPVAGHRTLYSAVLKAKIGCNLEYVIQHDRGWQENGVNGNETADWYGVNNYLFFHINDCWQFGVRGEWFRDDDGTRVSGIRAGNPNTGPFVGDFYEISAGMNWKPTCNVRLRPEVRWDWFDGTGQPFDDGGSTSQFLAAIDGIFLF